MDFDRLYLLVLKFLSFRPRSEKEVREYIQKKQQKFHGDDSFEYLIVHKLKQQKFLNDEEFAKWLVRSRTEFKPKGKRLIQQELRLKGISQDIMDQALENEEIKSDTQLAVELLSQKRKRYEHMEQQERFRKAGSMLARRGFNLDAIRTAIDQVFGKMV